MRTGSVIGGAGWLGVAQPVEGYTEIRHFRPARVESWRLRRLARLRARSRRLLEAWLSRCRQPYVSYSGGKDSTVLLALVHDIDSRVPAVYIADEEGTRPDVEDMLSWWREVRGADVRRLVWGSFFDAYRRYGIEAPAIDRLYSERVMAQVTALGYDGAARGLRAQESADRRRHARGNGPLYERAPGGFWDCEPLQEWEVDDIWAEIAYRGLPYCAVYDLDDGEPRHTRRVGTLWGTSAMQLGRIVRLKRFYPEHYQRFANAIPEIRRYG